MPSKEIREPSSVFAQSTGDLRPRDVKMGVCHSINDWRILCLIRAFVGVQSFSSELAVKPKFGWSTLDMCLARLYGYMHSCSLVESRGFLRHRYIKCKYWETRVERE